MSAEVAGLSAPRGGERVYHSGRDSITLRRRMSELPDPERSFLVQRFAKLRFGTMHVVGYSVAGEETVVQVPELNVCFDIGRAPYFALTSDVVCISHGHMDHMAGIAYYLSQRTFQGMKAGTVLVPAEMYRATETLLGAWRDVERQGT